VQIPAGVTATLLIAGLLLVVAGARSKS